MANRTIARTVMTMGLVMASLALATADQPAPPDVLKKAIAFYATLSSYSDTGTVSVDDGGTVKQSRFTTAFRRATRDLIFDFQDVSSTTKSTKFRIDLSASRSVLWMIGGAMQTYQYLGRTHEVVNPANGGQSRALGGGAHATSGASIMITSLLYSQARLPSTILQLEKAALAGVEIVNQRQCHKVTGTAAAFYPSGRRTGARPVTIWIDTETQLVRRVVEDTPEGYGEGIPGAMLRITLDYEPIANPAIDDGKFQFRVPAK